MRIHVRLRECELDLAQPGFEFPCSLRKSVATKIRQATDPDGKEQIRRQQNIHVFRPHSPLSLPHSRDLSLLLSAFRCPLLSTIGDIICEVSLKVERKEGGSSAIKVPRAPHNFPLCQMLAAEKEGF